MFPAGQWWILVRDCLAQAVLSVSTFMTRENFVSLTDHIYHYAFKAIVKSEILERLSQLCLTSLGLDQFLTESSYPA